jgi:hypothetical protein
MLHRSISLQGLQFFKIHYWVESLYNIDNPCEILEKSKINNFIRYSGRSKLMVHINKNA